MEQVKRVKGMEVNEERRKEEGEREKTGVAM